MKPIQEAVEAVAQALGLDAPAIARRKAFLELTDEDVARLKGLHVALQDLGPSFAQAFYDHLLRFEETRRFIPDALTLERLKQTQAQYFDSLTAGDYGHDYIRHRLRVGIAHQRVGLSPPWYLGAYGRYLAGLLPEIWQRLGQDPQAFVATCQALVKIVLLDMGLAIDTYIHADRQALLALREYAERVFESLPDGLVVLASNLTILSANRAFLERFRLKAQAIRGRLLHEVITAEGLEERLLEAKASGTTLRDLPFSLGPADSEARFPVRVTVAGMHLAEEEEEEDRLLMIIEDVTERQRLEERLRESESDLLQAQAVAHIGSWHLDFASGALIWTPEVYRIFGLPVTTPLSYETFLACVHPEDRPYVDAAWQTAVRGAAYQIEHRIQVGDAVRWVEERAKIERDAAGRPVRATGTCQDITERKRTEEQIRKLSRTYALLSDINQIIVRVREPQRLFEMSCETAVARGGFRLAWIGLLDPATRAVRPVAHAGEAGDYLQKLQITLDKGPRGRGPVGRALCSRQTVVVNDIGSDPRMAPWRKDALKLGYRAVAALPFQAGAHQGVLALYAGETGFFDQEELKLLEELVLDLGFALKFADEEEKRQRAEAHIQQLAFYDSLTGLPNRALFLDRLGQALAASGRHRWPLALLFLDLNRFSEINDSQGHAAGDRVLREVAQRFRTALRQEETLARLGGDEFVVLATGADQTAANYIAERLLGTLAEPLKVEGQGLTLTASIGIACYPQDGSSPEDLLKNADIAMYRAKAAGGGYQFYHPEMGEQVRKRLQLAQRLEKALEARTLELFYQPQVHLESGLLSGVEALLRWHDPHWGWVSPAELIPIAEERGLMGRLGNWVLQEACGELARWRQTGYCLPGRLAVNVTARQIEEAGFTERLLGIARSHGIDPALLEVEITESEAMRDPERAIEVTRTLTAAGLTLAIDDFGTGYSSLAYLKRFPAVVLKIDISFVRDMLVDRNDFAIVSAVIAMAQSLGLKTLAEGVESAEQARALKELGCDLAQGYYFGRPEPAQEFARIWLGR